MPPAITSATPVTGTIAVHPGNGVEASKVSVVVAMSASPAQLIAAAVRSAMRTKCNPSQSNPPAANSHARVVVAKYAAGESSVRTIECVRDSRNTAARATAIAGTSDLPPRRRRPYRSRAQSHRATGQNR